MGIYAALICVICTCETQTCDRIPQSKIKLPLQNIQKAHFEKTETETSTVMLRDLIRYHLKCLKTTVQELKAT